MKTYFTFGTADTFPYQDGYLTIEAGSIEQCFALFRGRYPDRTEGVLNCSDYYLQREWDAYKGKRYADKEPFEEIIISEDLKGLFDMVKTLEQSTGALSGIGLSERNGKFTITTGSFLKWSGLDKDTAVTALSCLFYGISKGLAIAYDRALTEKAA